MIVFRSGSLGDIAITLPIIIRVAERQNCQNIRLVSTERESVRKQWDEVFTHFGLQASVRPWPKGIFEWFVLTLIVTFSNRTLMYLGHLGSNRSNHVFKYIGFFRRYLRPGSLSVLACEAISDLSETARFAGAAELNQADLEKTVLSMRETLKRKKISSVAPDEPFSVIAVDCAREANRIPVGDWAKISEFLVRDNFSPRCVIVAKNQIVLNGEGVLNLTGQTSILDLFGLLAHADLYIGGDTGVSHVASLSCPRVLMVMGYRDRVGKWDPQYESVRVVRGEEPYCSGCMLDACPKIKNCVESIPERFIYEGVTELLSCADL